MNPIEQIALECGGAKRIAGGFICRCPAHEDRKPSLSISSGRDGKVLVRCHAGCNQRDVIAILRQRGLWGTTPKSGGRFLRKRQNRVSDEPDAYALKRGEAALAIWQASQPAKGTPAAVYLRSRGLVLPASTDLRFHPGLKHPSGAIWPAMVALVTDGVEGAPLAIHRTFLACDGAAKAPVDPAKMMLGPCRGGVVRLAQPGALLIIGEGIETCLSAMQATGHRAWAALSTSGLRNLNLPNGERDIIILADADEAGEAAAKEAARRWVREGRRVRIARPPQGMDFNDLLMDRALRIQKGVR
jgi:putative DNA primase/helicase